MDVRVHTDVEEFRAIAIDFFGRDPVLWTMELTSLRRLDDESLMVTATEDGTVVGAVLRLPQMPLLCGGVARNAVEPVVAALPGEPLSGVRGPTDVAEAFVSAWTARTGARLRDVERERLYVLDELRHPDGVDGAARVATGSDVDLVGAWVDEFQVGEFGFAPNVETTTESIGAAIHTGASCFVLWERDGVPVSLAGARVPVARMSRIGPVFTPIELRGNGFGSAVTAAASQWATEAGASTVVLFTNLANPTSNKIYQRIGYRPVTDFARIGLAEP